MDEDLVIATRVLVVEDSPILSMETEDVLSDAGYLVIGPAVDVSTALSLLSSHNIDAAVLDVNISGEDVFPVAYTLHERSIPFLFLTSYTHLEALRAEFRSYTCLEKPLASSSLLSALEILLER